MDKQQPNYGHNMCLRYMLTNGAVRTASTSSSVPLGILRRMALVITAREDVSSAWVEPKAAAAAVPAPTPEQWAADMLGQSPSASAEVRR